MSGVRAALAGLTTRGRCLLAAGVALGLVALGLGQRDLLRVAVLLVALPAGAVVVVTRTRYRLACTRRLEPARIETGRSATVRLQLENVSRLPSGVLQLEDRLPAALGGRPRFGLESVPPAGTREVSYPVGSQLRGRFVVGPLSVRLTDPFGLCELARSFASTETLVVTPVVTPLPAVRLGGDWAAGGDAAAAAVSTSGSDDVATREYRHGDDLRRVHWRSTARLGELMVRREEQPFQSRATLLLDGRGRAHRGDGPASSFEWAVSAAASIGVSLARSGFALSLLRETGEPLGQSARPLDGRPPDAMLHDGLLLDALADVTPSRTGSLTAATDRLSRVGPAGVLVAVLGTLDLDDAHRLARLRAGSAGCVAIVMDTASWLTGRPRPRADDAERVETVLAAAGWRVLPVQHGTTLASVWPGAAGGRPAARRRAAPVPTGTGLGGPG